MEHSTDLQGFTIRPHLTLGFMRSYLVLRVFEEFARLTVTYQLVTKTEIY